MSVNKKYKNKNHPIMIIEDDKDFAESLCNILELEDYYVIVSNDSDQALKNQKKYNPSICLVDMRLGTQNGIDLISRLNEYSPEIICVIITAYAEIDSAVKAIKENVYDYLRKPLYAPELFATLNRCFEKIYIEEQRKEAEKSLAESEKLYRNFFEEDISGDFIASANGKISLCNPPFAQIFSFGTVENAVKVNLKTLFQDEKKWLGFIKKLKEEKQLLSFEVDLYNADGSVVNIIANVIGKFDSNGQLIEMNGYLMDITNHKLIEKLYFQSQKMEAIGRFAGGIAHDFNNLLTIIINYSLIIKEKVDINSPILNEIEEVIKASRHAATLTKQLLTFSRKERIMPQVIKINTVIAEMKNMLKRLIGDDIRLETELDAGIGFIEADPVHISQIILNLLANSRDAMPDGGTLSIKTANRTILETDPEVNQKIEPGDYVELQVRDTGIGIDKNTQMHIFEPFYSTKELGKGTGLGLSTVFGIIKQSNGFITIDSEIQKGTMLRIFFPVTDKSPELVSIADPSTSETSQEATILIVEDNNSIRLMLRNILQNEGYDVLIADNGRHALEICNSRKNEIDLIITDLMMPEMGGDELANRCLEEYPSIKILFISGYAENILEKKDFNDRPGTDFMLKPFTYDDLVSRVNKLLVSDK